MDSSFFSTSSMKSSRLNAGLLLSSFRIVYLLPSINFFYHIIHLLEVNVCLAKNSQIFLFFESFFSINFVFLRAYSWSFRAISEETRKSFSGKYFFDVFTSVSFSPLIRPFVALTWTSTNCMLIKYCWNRAVC